MGTFYTGCELENPYNRGQRVAVPRLLVDTGSELTWIPAPVLEDLGIPREEKPASFVTANGQILIRSIGYAIVRAANCATIDHVVFAEKGDLVLLGARTLEGLNLLVDAPRRRLMPAGPIPAAHCPAFA